MVGREEISQRDKKLEEQRKEIELLKTQRKKTTESPDGFTEGKKCMQSPLIVERMNEQDDSDDIHQLTLDSISLSDDPGVIL